MTLRIRTQELNMVKTKAIVTLALASMLVFAYPTLAKMPKSIKYIEEILLDGDVSYVHYLVTCSNGTTVDISSWDGNKLWCQGKGQKEVCNKKKIKTAKQVCK